MNNPIGMQIDFMCVPTTIDLSQMADDKTKGLGGLSGQPPISCPAMSASTCGIVTFAPKGVQKYAGHLG